MTDTNHLTDQTTLTGLTSPTSLTSPPALTSLAGTAGLSVVADPAEPTGLTGPCRVPARMPVRVSFRFSAHGAHVVWLARTGNGPIRIESWSTVRTRAHRQVLPTVTSGPAPTQPLPLDDGRALLLRCQAGVHRLSMLRPGTAEQVLGEYHLAGLRLLPFPGRGALAVAVSTRPDGLAEVWCVTESGLATRPVLGLPGVLAGGCWLDTVGRRLVVNQATGARVRAVTIDLRAGTVLPLPESTHGPFRVLLAAPASGLLLSALTGPDLVGRLGWSTVDDPAAVRTPRALAKLSPARVSPLATDRAGLRVALRLEDAIRSRLAVFTPADERLTEVTVPVGCLGGVADWPDQTLRVPFSAPASPTGLAELCPDRPGSFRLTGTMRAGDNEREGQGDAGWLDARVERFSGPAGPIEALVYGNWRRARRTVVALHGGPDAAWRLCFEPVLQSLALSGLAVVAPNQRGSAGYGDDHQRAIHGRWGGPDLADIRCLAKGVRSERGGGRLGLFGTSYGAFLALLAAGTEPDLWSGCAVVAPFLSGPRLHAEAGPRVRALVDRLGGHDQPPTRHPDQANDQAEHRPGSGDVLLLAERIRARLLLVHGTADPVIPVSQSRVLRDHLIALGRREHTDFTYLEIPGAGHSPVSSAGAGDHLIRRLCGFLAEENP